MSIILFIGFAQADDTSAVFPGGMVMCSATTPKPLGFDLVKVRHKDRDYRGTFDLDNLRFTGKYRSSHSAFTLNINTLDDDGEVASEVLVIETRLRSGEFLHSKVKSADKDIEFYCYFLPEIK